MSWEEVAKEMEGMEGVISMMDEEGEDGNDNKEEEDKDGNDEEEEKNCDQDERGAGGNNPGLQSLLLSEILQFHTSRLRSVKRGVEKDGEQSLMESEILVENLDDKEDKEGTLTDISLFTTDSGRYARSGDIISNQVSSFFTLAGDLKYLHSDFSAFDCFCFTRH